MEGDEIKLYDMLVGGQVWKEMKGGGRKNRKIEKDMHGYDGWWKGMEGDGWRWKEMQGN